MYAKFSEVINQGGAPGNSQQYKFKQHYHVWLDKEFKQDCKVWLSFLEGEYRDTSLRPMVDLFGVPTTSTQIQFYSNASASKNLGFGALLNTRWIQGFLGCEFIQQKQPSIEYLELYALVTGIITWQQQPELVNCRITVFCDNKVVVDMINSMSSSCKHCMKLLRLVTLNGLRYN